MHMPTEPTDIDQNAIDTKIRNFMDRKTSSWRTLSDKIAERLAPAVHGSHLSEGIRYEQLKRS